MIFFRDGDVFYFSQISSKTEWFALLENIDDDAGVDQCFHNFCALSSRVSSRVISAGMMPSREFAIFRRSEVGLVSLASVERENPCAASVDAVVWWKTKGWDERWISEN